MILSSGSGTRAANKRSRDAAVRDIDKGNRDSKRGDVKREREALGSAVKGAAGACKARKEALKEEGKARVGETRAETRSRLEEMKRNEKLVRAEGRVRVKEVRSGLRDAQERVKEACALERARVAAPHKQRIEELTRDLRGSALAGIHARQREKAGVRSTPAERKQEDDGRVRNEVFAHDPRLVGLWERDKRRFKGSEHQSRYEEFMQWVHDTPEAVQAFVIQQSEVKDADLACQQAAEQKRHGDPIAAQYAAEHCEDDRAKPEPKRARPKGSPARRTVSFLSENERPRLPEDMPKAKKAKEAKAEPSRGRRGGQQSLSGGALGGSLTDPPF